MSKIGILSFASLAMALLAFSCIPVFASEPMTASGQVSNNYSNPTSQRSAGGNTIMVIPFTTTYTGDKVGTCVGSFTIVFHADGSLNFAGTCTFTGTIGSSALGSVQESFAGTGAPDGTVSINTFDTHGTDGLAGLHMVQTIAEPDPNGGTYSGQYHFDPS